MAIEQGMSELESKLLRACIRSDVRTFEELENADAGLVAELLSFTDSQKLLRFAAVNGTESSRYAITKNPCVKKKVLKSLAKDDTSSRVRSNAERALKSRSTNSFLSGDPDSPPAGVLENSVAASLRERPFF